MSELALAIASENLQTIINTGFNKMGDMPFILFTVTDSLREPNIELVVKPKTTEEKYGCLDKLKEISKNPDVIMSGMAFTCGIKKMSYAEADAYNNNEQEFTPEVEAITLIIQDRATKLHSFSYAEILKDEDDKESVKLWEDFPNTLQNSGCVFSNFFE